MENQNNNTGVNTVLMVIIIMILVAGLVWFFSKQAPQQVPQEKSGLEVDVNMPTDKEAPPTE